MADDQGPKSDSLAEAFDIALADELREVPSIAQATRGKSPDETTDVTLPPDEATALHTKLIWMLVRQVKALSTEVDRLRVELDNEADR